VTTLNVTSVPAIVISKLDQFLARMEEQEKVKSNGKADVLRELSIKLAKLRSLSVDKFNGKLQKIMFDITMAVHIEDPRLDKKDG
jgi:hypothetical protein